MIEIGVLVILKIEVLVCEVEFHSHRGHLLFNEWIFLLDRLCEGGFPMNNIDSVIKHYSMYCLNVTSFFEGFATIELNSPFQFVVDFL